MKLYRDDPVKHHLCYYSCTVARYDEMYHPTYMDADKTKMLKIKELDQGASYFQNGKVQYTQFQLEFN